MWKDIPGFEGLYQASDKGEIKSLERHVENGSVFGMTLKEKILKPTYNKNGYAVVYLRKDNKTFPRYVHRLVAETFIGKISETVNHIDGNKKNNTVENLEICSYSQNNQHAYDTGLHKKGEQHYKSRLSQCQVDQIRLNGKYDTYENIAREYGVSKATIRDILLNITHKS